MQWIAAGSMHRQCQIWLGCRNREGDSVGFLFFILTVLILVYLIIPFVLLNRMSDLRTQFENLERALRALDLRLDRLATATASAPSAGGAISAGADETPPAPPPAEPEPRRPRRRTPYPPWPRPASSATGT